MKKVYEKERCIEYESERAIFQVWEDHFKILYKEGANWCELEQTFRVPSVELTTGSAAPHLAEYESQHKDSDLRMLLRGVKSFRDALKP